MTKKTDLQGLYDILADGVTYGLPTSINHCWDNLSHAQRVEAVMSCGILPEFILQYSLFDLVEEDWGSLDFEIQEFLVDNAGTFNWDGVKQHFERGGGI